MRTVIPAGADINNYKTIGCFTSKDNANTATIINSPFMGTTTFTLDVGNATGTDENYYPSQTATEYVSRRIKSRTWIPEQSKWADWRENAQVESGIWTPESNQVELNDANSTWVKVGRIVCASFWANIKKGSSTDAIRFAGLPFAVEGAVSGCCSGFPILRDNAAVSVYLNDGMSIKLKKSSGGDVFNADVVDNNYSWTFITLTYRTEG